MFKQKNKVELGMNPKCSHPEWLDREGYVSSASLTIQCTEYVINSTSPKQSQCHSFVYFFQSNLHLHNYINKTSQGITMDKPKYLSKIYRLLFHFTEHKAKIFTLWYEEQYCKL